METSNHADEEPSLTEANPETSAEASLTPERVIDRGDHSISRRSIPENVLKVL
jgi:hypothetical protein